MIHQHFHWPHIREAVRKEFYNDDTCQRKKWSNEKYVKLPAEEDWEVPWNKICVDLIVTYIIIINGKK